MSTPPRPPSGCPGDEILHPHIRVEDFLRCNQKYLKLAEGCGEEGLCRPIDKKRLQKLGMALSGFTDYVQKGRIYVLGNTEWRYLAKHTPEERLVIFSLLRPRELACIIVTQGLPVPGELTVYAREAGLSVLQTSLDSSTAMYVFTEFLEKELSPRRRIHGVLMDVFGVGVLIVGESGIGKSECALELILRGHRIVADDVLEIRNVGGKHLVGHRPSGMPCLMELRGIGIVDVRELFGISATRRRINVRFIIELERWLPDRSYDRLGLELQTRKLFGIEIPRMTIPVAPGRNIGSLVEIACRVFLMRAHGRHPMGRFAQILRRPEGFGTAPHGESQT